MPESRPDIPSRGRTRLECDCMWHHPAGPEDRHLVSMNGDRVAVVGSTQLGDPDGLRIAGVDGATMGVRIACCQLTDQLDLCFRDRAHGHHHRSVEAAGSTAGEAGDEHRHQGAALYALRAERAGARSVEQRVRFQAPVNRSPAGRCAKLGLRARQTPDPDGSGICKWQRR